MKGFVVETIVLFLVFFSAMNLFLRIKAMNETTINGVYIPKDLNECFTELEKVLSEEELEEFRNMSIEDILGQHHSLGTWIRNNWGLWRGSRLAWYFIDRGVHHPDEMSDIILIEFHKYLNQRSE